VLTNRGTFGIDVLNLSLGHPVMEPAATDPLVKMVERVVAAGVVVVASAGNYGQNPENGQVGYTGISSPGDAPSFRNEPAWRLGVVWGSPLVWGDRLVWGD
jgi:hypothetical protein